MYSVRGPGGLRQDSAVCTPHSRWKPTRRSVQFNAGEGNLTRRHETRRVRRTPASPMTRSRDSDVFEYTGCGLTCSRVTPSMRSWNHSSGDSPPTNSRSSPWLLSHQKTDPAGSECRADRAETPSNTSEPGAHLTEISVSSDRRSQRLRRARGAPHDIIVPAHGIVMPEQPRPAARRPWPQTSTERIAGSFEWPRWRAEHVPEAQRRGEVSVSQRDAHLSGEDAPPLHEEFVWPFRTAIVDDGFRRVDEP